MKQERFDDIIRNKLDNINPENGIDVWSIFERKMEADQDLQNLSDDIEFDQTVHQKLNNHTPTYQSKHWNILKNQLLIIEKRIQTIWISKVLEISAIFLITFTFLQVSQILETPEKNIPTAQNIIIAENGKNLQNEFISSSKSIGLTNDVANTKILSRQNSNTYSDANSSIITNQGNEVVKSDATFSTSPFVETLDSRSVDHTSNLRSIALKPFAIIVDKPKLTIEKSINVASIDKIESLVSSFNLVSSEMAQSFPMTMVNFGSKAKKSISLYTSADVNLINTPFDKLYSLASYDKEALNDSYGINFSTERNNMEVEFGVGLAHRTYHPEFVTEAYGQFGDHYFEKSLKTISYDIINLPLNIKYHFINSNQWSTYLMVGASLNLIANADYEIIETLRDGRPANRFAPDQARLDEKSFTRGILHSGSLNENYFAAVGFGFGIEKKLFSNTSLYFQPNYQRHIFSHDIGIGPNKDKIHSASLQVGIKTTLN